MACTRRISLSSHPLMMPCCPQIAPTDLSQATTINNLETCGNMPVYTPGPGESKWLTGQESIRVGDWNILSTSCVFRTQIQERNY